MPAEADEVRPVAVSAEEIRRVLRALGAIAQAAQVVAVLLIVSCALQGCDVAGQGRTEGRFQEELDRAAQMLAKADAEQSALQKRVENERTLRKMAEARVLRWQIRAKAQYEKARAIYEQSPTEANRALFKRANEELRRYEDRDG